jgi:hypothetical protein
MTAITVVPKDMRRVPPGALTMGSDEHSPDHCERYRSPARQGLHARSSTRHLDFRCTVRD